MERAKYDALKDSFLASLNARRQGSFKELLTGVEKDFKRRKVKLEGKLEWNL